MGLLCDCHVALELASLPQRSTHVHPDTMHTPGPTHLPRFDDGFVFPTVMASSARRTVCVSGRARTTSSIHLGMSLHGDFADLTRLLEACNRRRKIIDGVWSGPREDGVRSRKNVAKRSRLNDWTAGSWRHCIPSANVEALLGRSGSESNEPSRICSCRCHSAMVPLHQLCEGECFSRS